MKRLLSTICAIACLILMMMAASCRSTRYVPVETVRTDSFVSVIRDTVFGKYEQVKTDSTLRRDSVRIKEYIRQQVDTAGNIIRTDREFTTYEYHGTEQYNALYSDYLKLEREFILLSKAYAEKKSEPYPVTEVVDIPPWKKFCIKITPWLLVWIIVTYAYIFRKKIKKIFNL